MNESNSTDESYFLLGTGSWRDRLPRVPRPVLAVGSRMLYRVLVEGSNFVLPLDGRGSPITGFFTTRFIAARSRAEAETRAHSLVLRDWKRQGFEAQVGGAPKLTTDKSETLRSRFRLRSGGGFTFFGESSDA
jgi:hypothetical protein